ncbi:MAG TPA: hypothetical protein VF191_11915 [Cyclobacteriaceae bacterium]
MKTLLVTFCLTLTFAGFGQTREIYVNPNFGTLAKNHKVLAILPFKAIVKLRPKQMKEMTPEQLEQLQKDEGLAVQSALQSYFLKRKEQRDLTISFQDIGTSNALLAKRGIDGSNIDTYTPKELCDILGVDGIISGLLSTDKPMSEGASVALGVLVGYYGSTNSGKCTININDGETGELLWKYEKTLSRSLGSDTNSVINTMMRKASRKFPYIKQ